MKIPGPAGGQAVPTMTTSRSRTYLKNLYQGSGHDPRQPCSRESIGVLKRWAFSHYPVTPTLDFPQVNGRQAYV